MKQPEVLITFEHDGEGFGRDIDLAETLHANYHPTKQVLRGPRLKKHMKQPYLLIAF
ncbi:hypothetical protein JNM87_02345 [Candidatus Saccharibacteria bacterium]|nr:hypothetical protein [Candidatus Saccharibacteria bacterium]